MVFNDLAEVTPIKTIPAKHGTPGSRVTVPEKNSITGHFNVAKAGNHKVKESAKEVEEIKSKSIQLRTPQTPRYKDALSKKGLVTPRHRVTITGKPMTPQTPRTPFTPGGSIVTVYGAARKLFTRSGDPGRLVGREDERKELADFVQNCIENDCGGCTYVSGPPGTGKSALVHEITENLEQRETVKKVYINCMSMKTSKDLYASLLESFCEDEEILAGQEVKALQGLFLPKKKLQTSYLVTLDEIDHILTLDLEILYKLFEWSLQKNTSLILIGIANALDLTDRFLPRLKARNLKPQLLPFLPYNAANIKAVITTRLKSLLPPTSQTPDYIPFIHPAAIELLSRKVSSQTGDLRKAFDICRRAIDLIETETRRKHQEALNEASGLTLSPSKQPLRENMNLSSPAQASPSKSGLGMKSVSVSLAHSLSTLTTETAPRATIAHINSLTSAALNNGSTQRLKTLNLQQKAALCALIALESRNRQRVQNISVLSTPSKTDRNLATTGAAPTIKKLYDTYAMLCKRDDGLTPLTSTEFRDVVGSLETLSLVVGVEGRKGSFMAGGMGSGRGRGGKGGLFGLSGNKMGDERRVGSCVGESEVVKMGVLEGGGGEILRGILKGEGLDD